MILLNSSDQLTIMKNAKTKYNYDSPRCLDGDDEPLTDELFRYYGSMIDIYLSNSGTLMEDRISIGILINICWAMAKDIFKDKAVPEHAFKLYEYFKLEEKHHIETIENPNLARKVETVWIRESATLDNIDQKS
jgi:hypothetical protein